MITFKCAVCGTKLSVPDSFAGKTHKCSNPNCDATSYVPTVKEAVRTMLPKQPEEVTCTALTVFGVLSVIAGITFLLVGISFAIPASHAETAESNYTVLFFEVAAGCLLSGVGFFFAAAVLKILMRIAGMLEANDGK